MLLALALPVLLAAAPHEPPPTRASLRKAYEHNAHVLVEVSGGRRHGTGVIVGASGQIVTPVDNVGLYEAKVKLDGTELPAKVLAANARLKIAVVEIAVPDGKNLAAPPAQTDPRLLRKGAWLVGIQPAGAVKKKQDPKPLAGRVIAAPSIKRPFVVTDLPLPPGSPLFDPKGRLVAVVVERVGRIGSKAVPLRVIQAQVAEAQARAGSDAP